MRRFKMSKRNFTKLANFKQEIGRIFRKIGNLDECEKTEAIRYLKQCVDSSTKTKMRNEKKHTNKVKLTSNLIKKKFALKKKLSQKTGELARVKPPVLKCKLCGETKPKKLLLLKHLETHIGTPITCIKCRRSFNSSFAFEWHFRHFCFLKRRGGERTFKCSECPKAFRYNRHLQCHLEGHKRNNCTYCDTVLTHRKELAKHMFDVHSIKLETAMYKCGYCEKRYVKRTSLYFHLQQHIQNKHICLECGTVNETYDEHSLHIKNHQEEKPYKCRKCEEKFARRQQYLAHLRRHDRYRCVTCKEGYASRAKALSHKEQGHEVEGLQPRMKCPYCPAAFHRTMSLQIHMKKHTDIKVTINCKYCDKTFQSPYKYYKHCMTVLHDKQSPATGQLVCNCGKQFGKKYLLEQHLIRVHNLKNVPVCCRFCDYKTPFKGNLERHMALHLDPDVRQVCDQCGKTYASPESLKSHISYMHGSEKQFKCKQCDRIFKRNTELVRHLATHTDNRPHACKICDKAYKRITHLRRHEEAAHKLVSRAKKVERLQTDANGELVPVVGVKEGGIEGQKNHKNAAESGTGTEFSSVGGNGSQNKFVAILHAVDDAAVVENELVYFNLTENL